MKFHLLICGYLIKLNQQTAKRKPPVRPNPVCSSFANISVLAASIDNLEQKKNNFYHFHHIQLLNEN